MPCACNKTCYESENMMAFQQKKSWNFQATSESWTLFHPCSCRLVAPVWHHLWATVAEFGWPSLTSSPHHHNLHIKTISKVIRQHPCCFLWPHLDFLALCSSCHPACLSFNSQPKCFHSTGGQSHSVFHLLHSLNLLGGGGELFIYWPLEMPDWTQPLTGVHWAELAWKQRVRFDPSRARLLFFLAFYTYMIWQESSKIFMCTKELTRSQRER